MNFLHDDISETAKVILNANGKLYLEIISLVFQVMIPHQFQPNTIPPSPRFYTEAKPCFANTCAEGCELKKTK